MNGQAERTAAGRETGFVAHREGVERLLASYRAIPADATVRLAKKTSNLFRAGAKSTAPGLDVSGLDSVISVDPEAKTADVAGVCTYEDLVAATLPYGLAPLVVPQLKTITLGGAVTGLGIESTSFRNGLPHESVLEIDILTGSGDIVTATPDGENADLFRGFPNSYGTLGYSTRLKIELETVQPYVELRHVRFHDVRELEAAMERIVNEGSYDGQRVDYLDGVVFTADESYLTLGRQTDEPGPVSDYTGMDVYYRSIQSKTTGGQERSDKGIVTGGQERSDKGIVTDRLTIHDYLWRWDTDWFWCSRAFGTQNPKIRRFWPKKYRRSSFYWKLIGLDRKYDIADRLEARKGNPPRERVVQDIEVPIERTADFIEWFLREIPIEPLWLCPLRLREPGIEADRLDREWPLYPLERGRTYVNVGFWSSVPKIEGEPDGATNKLIEQKVSQLDGHKSLYSDAFYDEDEFDKLYGGEHYATLKTKYDPTSRLLNLYAKAVRGK